MNLFLPLEEACSEAFREAVEDLSESDNKHLFTIFHSEKAINSVLNRHLGQHPSFGDLNVVFYEGGFEMRGRLRLGPAEFNFSANGIATTDPSNPQQLSLELYEAKLGRLDMPRFMRAQLQDVFRNASFKSKANVRIRQITYKRGGVEVSYVRMKD
ncbi:MAG: hypothetical protein HQL11_04285 [Candidatus Omnitrophica bacterium]|nr:hypothetical protein [Candidatus Omnitrophota bacterium]